MIDQCTLFCWEMLFYFFIKRKETNPSSFYIFSSVKNMKNCNRINEFVPCILHPLSLVHIKISQRQVFVERILIDSFIHSFKNDFISSISPPHFCTYHSHAAYFNICTSPQQLLWSRLPWLQHLPQVWPHSFDFPIHWFNVWGSESWDDDNNKTFEAPSNTAKHDEE